MNISLPMVTWTFRYLRNRWPFLNFLMRSKKPNRYSSLGQYHSTYIIVLLRNFNSLFLVFRPKFRVRLFNPLISHLQIYLINMSISELKRNKWITFIFLLKYHSDLYFPNEKQFHRKRKTKKNNHFTIWFLCIHSPHQKLSQVSSSNLCMCL